MEIVLLWLDELDDLVFSAFFLWRKLRPLSLLVALTAASSLHVLPRLGASVEQVTVLVYVVLAALALWGVAAAVSTRADRRALSQGA